VYEEGTLLGLGWVLSPGETAVSTQLPLERAAGGHIVPGDRVDVVCVLDRQPGWEEPSAFALLTRARVLAVNDQIVDAPVAAPHENLKREMSNEAILVTLGLPLEQAARLALAEEKGRISLALTSPLDSGSHSAPMVHLRSFKR
jgi:pilus assembly protein CpaB